MVMFQTKIRIQEIPGHAERRFNSKNIKDLGNFKPWSSKVQEQAAPLAVKQGRYMR